MTQDYSIANLLVEYLCAHPYLVAYIPVSLHQIITQLSLNQKATASITQFEQFHNTCIEFTSFLPHSFVYSDYKIHYFDLDVLIKWCIGIEPEEEIKAPSIKLTTLKDEILELISDNSSYLQDQKKELLGYLITDTAEVTLSKERALLKPPKPFTPVCTSSSRQKCLSKGKLDCLKAVHFEPVITNTTDVNLGDCSYLDTCYKGKGCKYVHYRIVYPEQKKIIHHHEPQQSLFYSTSERMSDAAYSEMPAQWISCDIRKLDLSLLGDFAAIIADPPWDIHMNGHMQIPSGAITDEEMMDFKIEQIQTEGVFFLWVTGRALDIGRQCLKKWGYNQIEELVWIKTNQLGRTICTGRTGHWLNHSKEHCLMGIKGSPSWLVKKLDVDTIVSATREKSRKPDELYDIIERLVGPTARKLELFGRENNIRPQWLTIGSQLDGTRLIEPDVAKRFHDWHMSNGM